MCTHSKEETNGEPSEEMNNSDSSTSDVSMSDSESDEEIQAEDTDEHDETQENNNENVDDEEEDEVIKAIKREQEKKRDHPPQIASEEDICDICFHPQEDIIAYSTAVGDIFLYKYANEENKLLDTLELHSEACRDIEFTHDGKLLLSASKDKSIMVTDFETTKLVHFREDCHEDPISCVYVIDENIFATGDDDGTVKLWDMRTRLKDPIYKTKKNEQYISAMISNEPRRFLVCASGDGSVTTIDLQQRKVIMQSEEYNEELTCLGLFKSETKILIGSSKGKLYLYNWNEFGYHSDEFSGNNMQINGLIPITENIVVTACEDGSIRAAHLFPHRHLGIVGQHKDQSVENIDICNNGQFIATSSTGNDIKFWNIQYFEDYEKVSHKHSKHEKKKDLENNLPSSKYKNSSDFFSGLC